jgi:hypothetical protein
MQNLPNHTWENWTFVDDLLADDSNVGYVTEDVYLDRLYHISNKTFNFTVLNEKVLTNYQGFLFFNFDFIFKAFNQKIVQMLEGGILKFIVDKEAPPMKQVEYPDVPIVLGLHHLGVWFHIWAVFLCVALLFLFLEFIALKVQKVFVKFLTEHLLNDPRFCTKTKHVNVRTNNARWATKC